MKKTYLSYKTALLTICFTVTLALSGCSEKLKHYEDPPWLGGANIETLEKKGNYTIYLKLMEIANYKDAISKQLFTLFPPSDSAFNEFFKNASLYYGEERGKAIKSVDDLTKDEAFELFTLHVLDNPINGYHLIYENQWGELQSPTTEYGSLFFRKPTLSSSLPYAEVPKYDKSYKGKTLLMFSGEKLVPLFSKNFFEDYFGATDGSDYKFMYPESNWGGLMQWGNARVVPQNYPATVFNLATPTASGFIYYLDQVVPPMKSIDQYLQTQPQYSLYYDLMQRFASYTQSKIDKQKRVLYKKLYSTISNLAEEQGPSPGQEGRRLKMFTLFAPKNEILQAYLDNTVLKYYPSIDSVPSITLSYIVQSQISDQLGLKSKLIKTFYNNFGDKTEILASDLLSGHMCSNGVVYEMARVLEPNVFSCVPGRLFFDSNYTSFLFLMSNPAVNMIAPLSNPDRDVTLFAVSNDDMEKYNIRLVFGSSNTPIIQQKVNGAWSPMNTDEMLIFAQDHVYYGKLEDLNGDAYIEMASHNFVHINNNKLYGGEDQKLGSFASMNERTENDRNGFLYTISEPIKTKYSLAQCIMDDPDFSIFDTLMVKAKLMSLDYVDPITKLKVPNISFMDALYYWTAFIPDNAAMQKAIGTSLDTSDASALNQYLLYHFVRKSTIVDDGKISGKVPTQRTEPLPTGGTTYSTLTIVNSINDLKIKDHSGQLITVNHANANKLVRRGVVHKITTALKY